MRLMLCRAALAPFWIAADVPGSGWLFRRATGWQQCVSGALPPYRDGTLMEQDVMDVIGGATVWVLVVLLLPLIGVIVWYFAGPGKKAM